VSSGRWRSARRLVRCALPLLLFTGCRFGAPPGATEQGKRISELYQLMFYVAIVVAATVYVLMVWCIVRYRRRPRDGDELPPQFRKHIPLEITYTIIPLLVVIGIFVATFRTENKVDFVSSDPALVVNVTAFQWQWRFEYPKSGVNIIGRVEAPPTLVLPVGQTVRINLQATDVAHAFFVPDFLFKRDAIPGHDTHFDLKVSEAGVFHGECAEFCGLDHGEMNFTVRAVSPAAFQQWVTKAQQGSVP
jgi:cytochrome c oxidase subunit 2